MSEVTGLHPVLQRVLSARGIRSFAETRYSLNELIRPNRISNLELAAERVARHIQNGSDILIFGDYDADGATSAALCVRALNMLGHHKVSFLLPDRARDGYGVSVNAAQQIIASAPRLLITVDTSVAHLAGALNRPAWVMIPFAPDWRWGLAGETSPWYPSLRLFRQARLSEGPAAEKWAPVAARMAGELAQLAGA